MTQRPDCAIKTPQELLSYRKKEIFIVTHLRNNGTKYGNSHIRNIFVGPIIQKRLLFSSLRENRFIIFNGNEETDSKFYVTDHGDWGNDKRRTISLFEIDQCFNDGLLDSIFLDKEMAEVWEVQLSLMFPKMNTSFKGYRTIKSRTLIRQQTNT